MVLDIKAERVEGLSTQEKNMLKELLAIHSRHLSANVKKEKYYEGNISLSEVNLGIAIPRAFRGLEIACPWGAKTVDVLAARSMFDGFVDTNGQGVEELTEIVDANRLIPEYMKTCRDELKFGCTFATLSADSNIKTKIRFHSPKTSAARWNGEKGRIDCGFTIIDTAPDNASEDSWSPSLVNLHTDKAIIVLKRERDKWTAAKYPHKMGRPLMEPLIWNATSAKPFGRSRIKAPIRRLIEGYVRTIANASLAIEFATAPQKFLMGVSEDMFDTLTSQRFQQYVGSIIAATTNPETGEKPNFGQLPQGNISPHIEMIRMLATQFSAATGLPVTDTGVINDANPTSSDAIEAQTKTLVSLAEELNTGNGEALRNIALMALAIANNTTIEELPKEKKDIIAHFKNPAMPSVAVTADAAIKIASARNGFAQTDTFLEMIGFGQADIRRIKAQEQRARGLALFEELNLNDNQ